VATTVLDGNVGYGCSIFPKNKKEFNKFKRKLLFRIIISKKMNRW
jgi:hypothetical protein